METNVKGKMMQHKFHYYLYSSLKAPFSPQSTEIQVHAVAVLTVLESTGTKSSLGDYSCDLSEDHSVVTNRSKT